MHLPSEEQQEIIKYIECGKNVIVDACAGSGKSTTILSCAKQFPNKKILQITYNKQLRQDVKNTIIEENIENMEVHTFHSLAVKYYSSSGFDDTGIRRILREKMTPNISIPPFDIIVLDECQDMTSLYFQWIVKYTKDMNSFFQLFILGDKRQGLYEFKGAYIGFLTFAAQIWKHHPALYNTDFVECSLNTSYRITNPMSHFVNEVMLGESRLIACKPGDPIKYIRRPIQTIIIIVIEQIRTLLRENKCTYGDIFILAASPKQSSIRKIENELVRAGIPCYIPSNENQDKLDSRVIDKKVVFSTFHAVKGRQRRFVFVVGFDNNYTTFYDKDPESNICPNTLYVGCTRATHNLFLLENESVYNRPLPFLKLSHTEMQLKSYIDFIGNPMTLAPVIDKTTISEKNIKRLTPSSLIQFVPEPVLDIITPILDRIFVQIPTSFTKDIDIPSVMETRRGYFEDISDLNGNAIPILFYDFLSKEKMANPLRRLILQEQNNFKPNEHSYLKEIIDHMPETCETTSDYLYLSNILTTVQDKFYSKISQIDSDEYTWLSKEVVEECIDRLNTILGNECLHGKWIPEKTIIHESADEDHFEMDQCLKNILGNEVIYRFTARTDLVTENTIWEWKCTSQITIEHRMQLVIYAWLWKMVYESGKMNESGKKIYTNPKTFKLFNIKTGELWLLDATLDDLTFIVSELLRGKYAKKERKTDIEQISEAISFF
jgi:hypothetical protein